MRLGLRCLVVVVGVVLLTGFAASIVSAPAPTSGTGIGVRSSGSSQKIHLIEGFTGTWCTWCSVFDPAINRWTDEHKADTVFLAYHGPPGSDPFGDASVVGVRGPFYTLAGYPTTIFDGGGATLGNDNPMYILGAYQWSPESYNAIASTVSTYTDTSSNIRIAISGDLTPTSATASVSITATDPVPQLNLYVRIVLYEDLLYYAQQTRPDGQRGVGFHENVARALNEQALTISMGQTVTKTATFTPQGGWNLNNLGVAAFVQSNNKRSFTITGYGQTFYASDVLNAAKYDFTPRGVLLYRDAGTAADYGELYEEMLAQAGERFEPFNTYTAGMDTGANDLRDLPSPTDLQQGRALVWMTGAKATPTTVLTQGSRDLITAHLSGPGDLLIAGSGIGGDAWTNYRSWFQTTLHATYNGDDTGQYTVQGVAGNPVGGAFSSTTLNLVGASSPDRIAAIAPAQTPFQYPTGPLPGSVNAQHDGDSRVVYLGFRYFDNVADTNRPQVMRAILDWLDGAAPPTVAMGFPTGGETLPQGSAQTIRWTANDVRIPTDGVTIEFNSNYPTGTWQTLASGQPNDGVYQWTVPNLDSASCRIRVTVRDSTGLSSQAMSGDFICGQIPYFQLSFTAGDLGWHLISHPMILGDVSIPSVLGSIAGSYSMVRWYDPANGTSPWQTYVPGRPWNSLQTLDDTRGFWINITAPCTLQIMGTRPSSPTSISLKAGWNLVGFPSQQAAYTVADVKTATGATHVEAFDGTAAPYYLRVAPDTDALVAGRGYWVYVPADATWSVPA